MKLLVIGSGAREHAIADTFIRQGHQVYTLPGNAGTDTISSPISSVWKNRNHFTHEDFVQFAREHEVDLTVVGPEAYLADGIVDHFHAENLKIFGPSQRASILESNKCFSKQFMKRYGIPTAAFHLCTDPKDALGCAKKILEKYGGVVIKPRGLTGGKGVTCCKNYLEAELIIDELLIKNRYGIEGKEVVIEEMLHGQEVSILAFCDGKYMLPMIPSQDHKRLLDGDLGPNTGGMGAYAPFQMEDEVQVVKIQKDIIDKTMQGLIDETIDYRGVLYFGIILTKDGPKVLEYNCRFGDPETQAIVPLLESDLAEIMMRCTSQKLRNTEIKWKNNFTCCIVLASEGYPENYSKGEVIKGLSHDDFFPMVRVYHAGTKKMKEDEIVTNGGRVLGVTGIGNSLNEAQKNAYSAIQTIHFKGCMFRKDIANRSLEV